ncbi:MAG: hypothetical protein QW451_02225 [Candidatus Aenigmatarchaeota archaeon]
MILTFFLRNLTSYENAKSLFSMIYSNVVLNASREKIESEYEKIVLHCNLYPNFTFSVNNLSVSCSEILGKNLTLAIQTVAYKLFDSIYFKEYQCSFLECLRNINSLEDFLVIFSNKAYTFFDKIFKLSILTTSFFAILLLISIESWSERFKTFGLEFLSIGIFFFVFPLLQNIIFKELPFFVKKDILDVVLNQFSSVFLFLLVAGALLIFLWILAKIFAKKSK